MVKRHARKNEAHGRRREHPDETHRQAVDAVRREDDGGDLVLVIDYPDPELGDAEACPECTGSGMSGCLYEQRVDADRPPLLVGTACPTCLGCGRNEHDGCAPGAHAVDDPDETETYLDVGIGEGDDQEDERCPSCQGLEFWYSAGTGEGDEQADAAHAQLAERARTAGVGEWDITAAAEFGELDALLGDGAQALAEAADTTVYLRMPCGCAADRVRTVRRDEIKVK